MESAYSEAKKALNPSAAERVVCRTRESCELESLLIDTFKTNKPLSLYVKGQPGTGKTLVINSSLETLKNDNYKFRKMFVNCMSITNIQALYKLIIQELSGTVNLDSSVLTPSKRTSKDSLCKNVEAIITSLKIHLVLVLDEIDQIDKSQKTPADFYKIFNWPFLPKSKLILIGIANSLDFIEKVLPNLELKPECKPKNITFLPYTKEEMFQIVKDRLSCVSCKVIEDNALSYCATKVASINGDIRRVLNICRWAIEYVEHESKVNPVIKTVGMGQMLHIFQNANPEKSLEKSAMPLLQKILLCTILICNKDMKIKEIPFTKLLEKFNKVCKSYSTEVGSDSEFMNLCQSLQDNALIEIKKSKEIRNAKFCLRLDEQDLRDRLNDETFMSDILSRKY